MEILISFKKLKSYCEREQFKGWDPYDGLNSKLFQTLPFLKKSSLCRLGVIQGFKRSPINLRKIALVPKKYNAKGIGLFLLGYCNLFKAVQANLDLSSEFGTLDEIKEKINELAQLLISLQSIGYSGACWGYDFDWQSKAFFLPSGTPTVVATSFAVEALLKAYDITFNDVYLRTAVSATDFVLSDLNRIQKESGFMFSYSPLDNQAVYNATLLGTKILSLIYHYTHNEKLKKIAYLSAISVCSLQNENGSFPHSDQIGNKWRDNFHTGFKLESLMLYQQQCNDISFENNINKGYDYWINHYFISEKAIAKYYDTDDENGLVDLHCLAQAISTIYKLEKMDENMILIKNIIDWSISNMQDISGYFYFQKNKNRINKTPYMRWPNAWMFYGMSYWILYNYDIKSNS